MLEKIIELLFDFSVQVVERVVLPTLIVTLAAAAFYFLWVVIK